MDEYLSDGDFRTMSMAIKAIVSKALVNNGVLSLAYGLDLSEEMCSEAVSACADILIRELRGRQAAGALKVGEK